MRRIGYQNAALTAIAVLLGLGMMNTAGTNPSAAQPASAQYSQPDAGGMISAAEQRKVMITELRAIQAKLDRLEGKLNAGINVRVTDMPAMKMPPEMMRRMNEQPRPAEPPQPAPAEDSTK